ncbi:MAG: gamma carbonic anhydrase family protein [Thermomicrobium sp.]|nr:gamma carbonic anhydrase family protein [Thermomicrobium sp.]MDW8059839.1 gamma carbonic anhydrase family protein [Thermomicrobium sp.]
MRPLVVPYRDRRPQIADDVFVAPGAVVIGDVTIGSGSSLWFGVVVRGDIGPIRIGARVNLQEGVVVHLDEGFPVVIEDDVTVGHGAIVHGARIEAGAQIGMGAVLLTGSRIGAGAIVAAGAVVPEGLEVPAGTVAMGIPARVRREVSAEERAALLERARRYAARGAEFRRLLASLGAEDSP